MMGWGNILIGQVSHVPSMGRDALSRVRGPRMRKRGELNSSRQLKVVSTNWCALDTKERVDWSPREGTAESVDTTGPPSSRIQLPIDFLQV